jgi:4-amino-4-deoxy-L-arabinose transferase-like glycosyltransferase
MKRVYSILGLIVVFGAILRFFYLGKTPIAMEWDEVALGYDAYSILKTGRDQFGQFLPNNFRSLDDWKPPLYVYSAAIPIAIFGLTDFATRFPSAIYGTIAVLLTFFFVRELLSARPEKEKNTIALLSSFFLAISPWHLQFSRASFETNISVTVTLAAVLTFIKGIRENRCWFIISSFLFGIALFSYHSTRVVTPLILFSLIILFRKKLPGKKIRAGFTIIYAVFWIFFFPIAFSKDAQIRFIVTNDLKVSENQLAASGRILQDEKLGIDQGLAGKIIHNRRLAILNYENVQTIFKNYLSHFSPEFLFVTGDAPLHHAPGFGMMYFFDAVFLIAGIFYYIFVFRKRENLILPIWLLLAPIPAAVTWQAPHSVRAEIILPTLQIISAMGLYGILNTLGREWNILENIVKGIAVVFIIFGVSVYLHQYYIHTNIELSDKWLYGRKEAVQVTESLKQNYDKVYVSLKVDMPYIFWLYYTHYDPVLYLQNGGTVSGGFADERNAFDKYEFRNFDYDQLPRSDKILVVGTPKDIPAGAEILHTIYYLNGTPALLIAQNRT